MDPRIPEKLYYRIGEVGKIAGVQPYVLRFWETEFPMLRPSKSKTNRRMYSRDDVEQVLRIRDLLYERGFTIPGARRLLGQSRGNEDVSPLSDRDRAVLEHIRNDAQELLQLVVE